MLLLPPFLTAYIIVEAVEKKFEDFFSTLRRNAPQKAA